MTVPKFNEIFPAFMLSLKDGNPHKVSDIREFCSKYMNLSDADNRAALPSGGNMFANRVGWARTYLKKAGLIDALSKGNYVITEEGQKSLAYGAEKITLDYLEQYECFRKFLGIEDSSGRETSTLETTTSSLAELTKDYSPQDLIDYALKTLQNNISDELLTEILKVKPYDFERLVVTLLQKMGYGKFQSVDDSVTKKSGDEGIDGIVTTDKFGFDSLYVQAKRWNKDATVGRPEIQKFLGALAGQGATKGLFITTCKYSKEAVEYAQKQLSIKLILIDGVMLTKLMMEYEIGVSTEAVYKVKRIDSDFFNDEI